ncbi:SPFH domain-containing protein [Lipingzhangella sp. LS1_29]|uniref:SPFH domain-containing protein n=1 Tax=Lipingzhangella rawalii TaxID=2055835 RepID=A0ABU2H5E3_9ACTN|nr:SPFH domain-containing protein [Lipingzhangella rawalii]MDS1270035.1 SPFH domain-containing protein [Lipingzhangella rawalii]
MESPLLYVFLGLLVVLVAWSSIRFVRPGHVAVVTRRGRLHRTLRPGLNPVVPLLDRIAAHVDQADQELRLSHQAALTRDGHPVAATATVRYRIVDARTTLATIGNHRSALTELAGNALRLLLEDVSHEEIPATRGQLDDRVWSVIDESVTRWGVQLVAVEVTIRRPPENPREGTE